MKAFYRKIADDLHSKAGVRKQDVFINLRCLPENWSFGNGEMQYTPKQWPGWPSAGMRGGRHDEQRIVVWSRPQMTGDKLAELQSAIYDAFMNQNSNQSRFYIAPGTSSARRPACKPYEPQK
jgi:Tautomerase enzyme